MTRSRSPFPRLMAATLLASALLAAGCSQQESADARRLAEWVAQVATQVEKTAASQAGHAQAQGLAQQPCPIGHENCHQNSAAAPMRDIQDAAAAIKTAAALIANLAGEVEKIPSPFTGQQPEIVMAPGAAASATMPVNRANTAIGAPTAMTAVNAHAALLNAAWNGDAYAAQRALAAGAAINRGDEKNGATALMYAAHNGHASIVKLLLDAGANANRSDDAGRTALQSATENGHHEIAAMLRAAGARG